MNTSDNYETHKHPKVKAWLEDHPRFHLHFTPPSAWRLNLVERWFGISASRQAAKRDGPRRIDGGEGALAQRPRLTQN
jgi:hypothetical protein